MSLALVLPWFPIVLAVGVGARLLDRKRGTGLGILASLFWVLLVLSGNGAAVALHPSSLMGLLAGSLAIVAMGAWSASTGTSEPEQGAATGPSASTSQPAQGYLPLEAAMHRFDDWLEAHRYNADPWPEFGELLRVLLYDVCGAAHVHPYRILAEDDVLVPLRAMTPGEVPEVISAREGLVGHVATSGRSYLAGDSTHGRLVDQLAAESDAPVAWCFAISQGPRRIGLVRVGCVAGDPSSIRGLLQAAEAMVCLFWNTLSEVCRSRLAETRDLASGLLNREPFLIEADRVMHSAYQHKEPVAVAIISLEGTRGLCDRGEWQRADQLISEAAAFLGERVRGDDRLGRFDDSRFALLLRRVDSALGRLIVEQLQQQLEDLCADAERWTAVLHVRCGLAGSGTETPNLSQLIARAVSHCNQARDRGVPMQSDLGCSAEQGGPNPSQVTAP